MPRLVAFAHFPSDPDTEGFSRSDYSRIARVPVHQDSSVSPQNDAISRWMKRSPRDSEPAQRWLAFLRDHREALVAMDFFAAPTITSCALHGFFVISGARCRSHRNACFSWAHVHRWSAHNSRSTGWLWRVSVFCQSNLPPRAGRLWAAAYRFLTSCTWLTHSPNGKTNSRSIK